MLSSVQSLSRVRLFVTPWIAARQASPSITNSRSSLTLMCIESVMPSSHLILCRPLLLLPPIRPTHILNTIYLHFINILFWVPCSLQDLSSSTRDWIRLLAAESTKSSPLDHQGTSCSIHFTLGLKRKGESSVHCKLISVPGGISAKRGLALSMTLVRVSIFRGSWARQKRLIQAAAFQHECCAGITISTLQR